MGKKLEKKTKTGTSLGTSSSKNSDTHVSPSWKGKTGKKQDSLASTKGLKKKKTVRNTAQVWGGRGEATGGEHLTLPTKKNRVTNGAGHDRSGLGAEKEPRGRGKKKNPKKDQNSGDRFGRRTGKRKRAGGEWFRQVRLKNKGGAVLTEGKASPRDIRHLPWGEGEIEGSPVSSPHALTEASIRPVWCRTETLRRRPPGKVQKLRRSLTVQVKRSGSGRSVCRQARSGGDPKMKKGEGAGHA